MDDCGYCQHLIYGVEDGSTTMTRQLLQLILQLTSCEIETSSCIAFRLQPAIVKIINFNFGSKSVPRYILQASNTACTCLLLSSNY